ncbi:MAG TPA: hypothetical protein V6D00_04160 [Pantanalinema sp.]
MSTEQAFICPSCQRALQRATVRLYACQDCRIVAAIYEDEGNALIISSPAGASTTLPLTALEG